MASATDVLTALRIHLVGAGLVRKASIAGAAPPVFIEPIGGTPGPGEGEPPEVDPNLHIGLFAGGDIPIGEQDGFMLKTTIDVRYRGRNAQQILNLDNELVKQLHDAGGQRRRGWTMGGLFMVETGVWTGCQPLGRSKAEGYEYVTKVYAETYR